MLSSLLFSTLAYVIIPTSIIASLFYANKISKKSSFKDSTVVLTGGSMGIGKALAINLISNHQVKNLIIVARTKEILEKAKEDIEKFKKNEDQKVIALICDVTDKEQVKGLVEKVIFQFKSIDFLILNQGNARPGYFLEQDEYVFEDMMKVNYFGSLYMTKAFLPYMLKNNKGNITFVCSAAGLTGLIGFSSYCPSKFAIRGLAESLHNELQGHNIGISIAYPPDTDTPGYKNEQTTKPEECHEISKSISIQSAETVASSIAKGITSGAFHITSDLSTRILVSASLGLSQRTFPLLEFLIAPLISLAGSYTRWEHDSISLKGLANRQERFTPRLKNL